MIIDTTIGERGLTERYPELGTGPVSTEPYYSEAHYELEKQRLFKRAWLSIGRVEQVAEPGDYFVADLAVADTSILIVRGEDNQIRGFHNMCSHRGNKLVWEEKGSSKAFPCRLHGWTYLTDGSLRSVPDENMFYALDKARCGLTPVNLDVHEGFIFVNLQPEPSETLADYLVHLTEGTYFTHQFWPLAADRTLWEGCTYYEPADNAAERFRQEHVHLLRRESWLEDTRAMESVQAMLKSGARDRFIFHDHELLLRHTYKTVMDYVRDD